MFITTTITYGLLVVLTTLFAILFGYIKWNHTYWKRKGLHGPKPTFLFGNILDVIRSRKTIFEVWKDVYFELKSKNLRHGGGYLLHMPQYVPVDLEIIKAIFQSDATQSHGMYYNMEHDPISGHLVALYGPKWKMLRSKVTPMFSPAKLKVIFEIMKLYAEKLEERLEGNKLEPVDVKDTFGRFSIDVIGASAFGLECNALKGSISDFFKNGKNIVNSQVRFIGQILFPHWLLDIFKFHPLDPKAEKYFEHLVRSTVKYREETSIVRRDYLHMLIQLKNRGLMSNDDQLFGKETIDTDAKLSMEELVAQSFVILLAGYETSSGTVQFATYELAVNQDCQERARREIHDVMKKHNNNLTFEALSEMAYLESVVNEALRKYPPVIFMRQCTEDFKIPGCDFVLEKGTYITLPVLGVHYDPDYYPEPEKFDPDRFSPENKKKIPTYAFLPFGEGPRICLGKRLGLLQSKLALYTLLRNYKFSLSKTKKTDLEFEKKSITLTFKQLWIDLEKINNT